MKELSLIHISQGCNNLLEKMAGMNEDAKNSAMKLHEVKPVSYTHLDVYKRQLLYFVLVFVVHIVVTVYQRHILAKQSVVAVSYTHLDVYKRQA